MVYGTPVITHNNFSFQMPEFEAIIEGETGGYFEYNEVDSLVSSIIDWFENKLNRDELRQNCQKVIDEKYNPHVQLEIIRKVILETM
jgi:glycosyltransferase involved in cell wall biosynthesis